MNIVVKSYHSRSQDSLFCWGADLKNHPDWAWTIVYEKFPDKDPDILIKRAKNLLQSRESVL